MSILKSNGSISTNPLYKVLDKTAKLLTKEEDYAMRQFKNSSAFAINEEFRNAAVGGILSSHTEKWPQIYILP